MARPLSPADTLVTGSSCDNVADRSFSDTIIVLPDDDEDNNINYEEHQHEYEIDDERHKDPSYASVHDRFPVLSATGTSADGLPVDITSDWDEDDGEASERGLSRFQGVDPTPFSLC